MRRVIGVVGSAALALLLPHAALAAMPPADLGPIVMQRVFGESADANASLAAAMGDRADESPLRELALGSDAHAFGAAPYDDGSIAVAGVGFSTATVAVQTPAAAYAPIFGGRMLSPSASQFVALSRAPLPKVAVIPPGRVSLYRPAPAAATGVSLADTGLVQPAQAPAPFADPNSDALASGAGAGSAIAPVSSRVGRLQFQGRLSGLDRDRPDLNLRENGYGAGATFDLRAGGRQLGVDVDSSYEHLMRDDTTAYSSTPLDESWQIGGDNTPAVPNYADVSKLAVGANLAVPVTHTLTLNLNYNAQRLLGAYGLPGLVNLNAIDNSYGGN
ncbi:MAG TPA: hypothetical protein VMH02_07825, partial [Verrucomicrobiae bacterium]|nr:hypothetical protein [Verrucomicrobiae bacterium]